MMHTARATSRAERTWLRETLGDDTPEPVGAPGTPGSSTLDAPAS
ncbi:MULTISPECIES: hypothetical protein [unclassified Nocardia]